MCGGGGGTGGWEGVCVGGGWKLGGCVCVWGGLSGIHSELPIKGLGVQGQPVVIWCSVFSLSSSGCSDHPVPPHQLTQL